jgi:hypothetical protein
MRPLRATPNPVRPVAGTREALSIKQKTDFAPGISAEVMFGNLANEAVSFGTECRGRLDNTNAGREEYTYLFTPSHRRHYDQRHAPGPTKCR